jgi:hypothetical protein
MVLDVLLIFFLRIYKASRVDISKAQIVYEEKWGQKSLSD